MSTTLGQMYPPEAKPEQLDSSDYCLLFFALGNLAGSWVDRHGLESAKPILTSTIQLCEKLSKLRDAQVNAKA